MTAIIWRRVSSSANAGRRGRSQSLPPVLSRPASCTWLCPRTLPTKATATRAVTNAQNDFERLGHLTTVYRVRPEPDATDVGKRPAPRKGPQSADQLHSQAPNTGERLSRYGLLRRNQRSRRSSQQWRRRRARHELPVAEERRRVQIAGQVPRSRAANPGDPDAIPAPSYGSTGGVAPVLERGRRRRGAGDPSGRHAGPCSRDGEADGASAQIGISSLLLVRRRLICRAQRSARGRPGGFGTGCYRAFAPDGLA